MATDGLYRPLTTLSFLIDRTILGHGDVASGYVVDKEIVAGSAVAAGQRVYRIAPLDRVNAGLAVDAVRHAALGKGCRR